MAAPEEQLVFFLAFSLTRVDDQTRGWRVASPGTYRH